MAVSIEDLLSQTLQVTDNFSKFVEKSGLPYAALLLSAIDFGSVLLDHKSEFWIFSNPILNYVISPPAEP